VWFPFAFGFLFFAFLFPAVRASLQIVVLTSLRFNWKVPQRGRLFRWSEELRIWSMTDVVVIAGAVAYRRADISAELAMRPRASLLHSLQSRPRFRSVCPRTPHRSWSTIS